MPKLRQATARVRQAAIPSHPKSNAKLLDRPSVSVEDRLRRLEDRTHELQAIIDGSEFFTREATVHLVGTLVIFLEEKGVLDHAGFRELLAGSVESAYEDEDDTGKLMWALRSWLQHMGGQQTASSSGVDAT